MEPLFNSDPTVGIDLTPVAPVTAVSFLKKKVMIALPWGKSVHPITSFCVTQLTDRRRGVTSVLNFGDAFISHSRNSIACAFLKSDCEYLLMSDDDMVLPFGNAEWYRAFTGWSDFPEPFASFNVIDRLLSHNVSIVGACYKGRYEGAHYVYGEGSKPQEKEFVDKGPRDEIRETRWCGTGALMIRRDAFEAIEKKYPLLARGIDGKGGHWFTSSEHTLADAVFRTRKMLSEGAMTAEKGARALQMLVTAEAEAKSNSLLGVGEDVQFCLRAKAAGHPVYVDHGLRCGHIGHKVY